MVAYYLCYWDEVNKKELKVGLDTFRGVSSWAKKKYQFVVAWAELPKPFEPK